MPRKCSLQNERILCAVMFSIGSGNDREFDDKKTESPDFGRSILKHIPRAAKAQTLARLEHLAHFRVRYNCPSPDKLPLATNGLPRYFPAATGRPARPESSPYRISIHSIRSSAEPTHVVPCVPG